MPAKPSVVPGTILDPRFGIYVQKRALFVAARVETRIEVTLRHLRHVELVKEFALVTLLAETAKPVFTYHSPVTLDVPKGTRGPFAAASLQIEATHSCSRLVHTGKRQRQRTQLPIKSHLQLEDDVSHSGHYFFHRTRSRRPLDSACAD